jgi:hypothetical protein
MKTMTNKIIACAAALLLVLVFVGALACSKAAFSPPPASSVDNPPVEAVALQMWQDYQADAVAAAAKYEGNDLHFARVRVDQMSFLGEGADQELYVQEGIDPKVERVKFRTDYGSDIVNVREGYIVEIVGKALGVQFGYVVVKISWLKVIDPPGGDTNPPSEY